MARDHIRATRAARQVGWHAGYHSQDAGGMRERAPGGLYCSGGAGRIADPKVHQKSWQEAEKKKASRLLVVIVL